MNCLLSPERDLTKICTGGSTAEVEELVEEVDEDLERMVGELNRRSRRPRSDDVGVGQVGRQTGDAGTA